MYKLLLCLRYLRRQRLAYLAAAGVALCVFMMLVAVSVMNGFLHKVEKAAKGLHGDIIIEPNGLRGLKFYDKLAERVVAEVDAVQHASPFILSYGILRVPGQDHYRQTVQIAGIRLPDRAKVSNFEQGLFVQRDWPEPTFSPPHKDMQKRAAEHRELVTAIIEREKAGRNFADLPADKQTLVDRLETARSFLQKGWANLENADANAKRLAELEAQLAAADAEGRDAAYLEAIIQELEMRTVEPWPNHVILGLGMEGMGFRTDQGETVRVLGPGNKVTLYVFPLGRHTLTDMSPNIQRFTIVDDCSTDVYSFDSQTVYVPFDALQRLNNMGPVPRADGTVAPALCSMVHVKVDEAFADWRAVRAVRDEVRRVVADFYEPAQAKNINVLTWREKQDKLVSSIESQRMLVMIMFGILSLVSVLLVFVIFYMVVAQKTRDIGVLKSLGASGNGVAAIFLAFGAVIGLVGAIVGAIGGCLFIHNINAVHDALYNWLGFRVWSRESFFFDRIPNEIDVSVVSLVVGGAIVAAVVGALAPAIRAARMEPVEALRYE